MLVVGIILGVIFLIFIVQNLDTVSYQFLTWTLTTPRFLVFIVMFATGWILGWSARAFKKPKKKA